MNILDENIPVIQRGVLRNWRIPIRHLGYDIGRKGMKDEVIIPFLLTLPHPTFFTLDWDYFKRHLCHARYCLVHLDIRRDEVATFAACFAIHNSIPEPNAWAQSFAFRMQGLSYGIVTLSKKHATTGWTEPTRRYKPMSVVIRASHSGLTAWRLHAEQEAHYDWKGATR